MFGWKSQLFGSFRSLRIASLAILIDFLIVLFPFVVVEFATQLYEVPKINIFTSYNYFSYSSRI
jgi:hypothetical protein